MGAKLGEGVGAMAFEQRHSTNCLLTKWLRSKKDMEAKK